MTAWDMYWFTRLDALQVFFVIAATISMILTIILVIIYFVEGLEDETTFKRWVFALGSSSILLCMCLVFIPTTKEAAAIYLVPKIANNEKVNQMPDKVLTLMNSKLDEWLDSIKREKK